MRGIAHGHTLAVCIILIVLQKSSRSVSNINSKEVCNVLVKAGIFLIAVYYKMAPSHYGKKNWTAYYESSGDMQLMYVITLIHDHIRHNF